MAAGTYQFTKVGQKHSGACAEIEHIHAGANGNAGENSAHTWRCRPNFISIPPGGKTVKKFYFGAGHKQNIWLYLANISAKLSKIH